MKKIEVEKASTFAGSVISNSIAGFIITTSIITAIFTLLWYPLFWEAIWYYRSYLTAILFSYFAKALIDGYLTSYAYERLYGKNRALTGIMDTFHFFLSILEGIGAAIVRFNYSLFALVISQSRMDEACLPAWLLKIKYLDSFHLSYHCYIYNQHVHNHPIQLYAINIFIKVANEKSAKRFEI